MGPHIIYYLFNYKLLSAILNEEIKNGVKDIDVNKGLVVNYRLLSESEVKDVIVSLIDNDFYYATNIDNFIKLALEN